jgi:hypothetical protein
MEQRKRAKPVRLALGRWDAMDERTRRRRGGPTWLNVGGKPIRPNPLRDTRLSVHEETAGDIPAAGCGKAFAFSNRPTRMI